MDRTYGTNTSQLRCEDESPIIYAQKRKEERKKKEERALSKIDSLISEIILISIGLKGNPLKAGLMPASSNPVIIKATMGEKEKIDRIKILMMTEIDPSVKDNKVFLEAKELDRVEYLVAVDELVQYLGENKTISSLKQYTTLKELVSFQKTSAIVKKYKKLSRGLDDNTLMFLAQTGALK